MWPFKGTVTFDFDPQPDITVYELARIVAGNSLFKGMEIGPRAFEESSQRGRENATLKRHFKFSD